MEKGYINIDENEINDITGHLNRNQSNLTSLGSNSKGTFKSLTNTNLFGNGIQKINQQVSSISTSIGKMNEAIKTKTNEMMQLDDRLANKAENITVPMNFVTENSVRPHIFDGIVLNKKDGKSVSDDDSLIKSELDLSSSVSNQSLQDITTEKRDFGHIKLNEYKNKTNKLGNINNNRISETNQLNYSDEGIISQNLQSINNNNNINTSELDNTTYIKSTKNLQDIELNTPKIIDEYFYDDFYDEKNYE